jgi:hypothetical protein
LDEPVEGIADRESRRLSAAEEVWYCGGRAQRIERSHEIDTSQR